MELADRKALRLSGHDYNEAGCYFSTFCTYEMQLLLGSVVGVGAIHESPEVQLSAMGKLLDYVIHSVPSCFPEVSVEKYVIMPNHVHLILCFHSNASQRAIRESPLRTKRSLYSKVIGYIKATTSKEIHRATGVHAKIWQRGSYDHVIRNERDFRRIWDYIDTNPSKWAEDCYYYKGTD